MSALDEFPLVPFLFGPRGEAFFNGRGFEAGRSFYDGVLRGRPFRSVARIFQIRVWPELRCAWNALTPGARSRVEALPPADVGLDRDGLRSGCGHRQGDPRAIVSKTRVVRQLGTIRLYALRCG